MLPGLELIFHRGCLSYGLQRVGRSLLLVKFSSGPGPLCTTTVRQTASSRTPNDCQHFVWERLNLCVCVCAAAVLINQIYFLIEVQICPSAPCYRSRVEQES